MATGTGVGFGAGFAGYALAGYIMWAVIIIVALVAIWLFAPFIIRWITAFVSMILKIIFAPLGALKKETNNFSKTISSSKKRFK